jgi:hypothetical protein
MRRDRTMLPRRMHWHGNVATLVQLGDMVQGLC